MLEKFEIKIPKTAIFSDDELFKLCPQNAPLQFERTKQGNIIVTSPTGGKTSKKNFLIILALGNWWQETQLGDIFESNGGFLLPDNSIRVPDLAWLAPRRWNTLNDDEQDRFMPICPDFVTELISKSDVLKNTQEKMQSWMDNGRRLAWLIHPNKEKAFIYRPEQAVEEIQGFDQKLSGEDVLLGFELDLSILRD